MPEEHVPYRGFTITIERNRPDGSVTAIRILGRNGSFPSLQAAQRQIDDNLNRGQNRPPPPEPEPPIMSI
jgi:hypothetical protein